MHALLVFALRLRLVWLVSRTESGLCVVVYGWFELFNGLVVLFCVVLVSFITSEIAKAVIGFRAASESCELSNTKYCLASYLTNKKKHFQVSIIIGEEK